MESHTANDCFGFPVFPKDIFLNPIPLYFFEFVHKASLIVTCLLLLIKQIKFKLSKTTAIWFGMLYTLPSTTPFCEGGVFWANLSKAFVSD